MVSTEQRTRVMLECDSIATANEVVFTLSGHITVDLLGLGELIQHAHHLHSQGRFVYLVISAECADVYKGLQALLHAMLHRATLVGLSTSDYSWDELGLCTLVQHPKDTVQEELQSRQQYSAMTEYMSRVNTEAYSDEQLYDAISRCRLGDASAGFDMPIKDTLRMLETSDTIEQSLSIVNYMVSEKQFIFGQESCESNFLFPLWRTIVHLIVCSDFI